MGVVKELSRVRVGFSAGGASEGPRQMGETGLVLCEEARDGEPTSEVVASVKIGEAKSERIVLLALLTVRSLGGGRASSLAMSSSSSNLVVAPPVYCCDVCCLRRSNPKYNQFQVEAAQ